MRNVEIAREFLDAMAARDFDVSAVLLAADAEVVLEPFETPSPSVRRELEDEAGRLEAFLAD